MKPDNDWLLLARHTPLGILADLDGTLIPFAPTPDQSRVPAELVQLLESLASRSGLSVAVVSGRPREALERLLSGAPSLWLMAEHGGWRRSDGAWSESLPGEPHGLDALAGDLERLCSRFTGSFVERKTWSVAVHHRLIPSTFRGAFIVEAIEIVDRWLSSRPDYERLDGALVLEVRSARVRKSLAVSWMRERAGPGARLLTLGDDVTDEDVFRALGPQDVGILIASAKARPTSAHFALENPDEAGAFLRWIAAAREEAPTPPLPCVPRPLAAAHPPDPSVGRRTLLVVSNRLPNLRTPTGPSDTRRRNVGGLVSALEPLLEKRGGLWLGWSGRTDAPDASAVPGIDDATRPTRAWIDLPADLHRLYYNGFCNSSLWPLLHTFPARVRFADEEWEAYVRVNDLFAEAAHALVRPEAAVWVHDYHLLLLGAALRRRGHRGPLGLFLHVPFPGPDLIRLLPWAERVVEDLLSFDLIGFHTANDVSNFLHTVGALSPADVGDDAVEHRGRRTRVGAFPIGIMPDSFQMAPEAGVAEEVGALIGSIGPTCLILGVDRLDYTKGIPERLAAFARMLELFPERRGKVSLIQISVPSREDVPDYREQRNLIETAVGRINGEFGEAHWTPVRYLYRAYGRNQLSQFYRAARVGLVTPLRDGMNLVSKEFVAAQDPEDPGVLVLSRFAGAAAELSQALLTNPWHVGGMARDLERALGMPLSERRERHGRLLAAVQRTTALGWGEDFVKTLEECR